MAEVRHGDGRSISTRHGADNYDKYSAKLEEVVAKVLGSAGRLTAETLITYYERERGGQVLGKP